MENLMGKFCGCDNIMRNYLGKSKKDCNFAAN